MNNLLRYILKSRANKQYQQRGYHLFRAGFPREQIDMIADLAKRLILPYRGEILRQEGGKLAANEFFPGTQIIRNSAFNPHLSLSETIEPLSAALRALITSPALADRLRDARRRRALYDPTDTSLLRRSIDRSSPRQLVTGHRAPRLLAHGLDTAAKPRLQVRVPSVIPWPRGKLVTEQELGLADTDISFIDRYERYHRALSERLLNGSPEAVTPLMRKGDFVVWSSLTPHFTLPSLPFPTQRLSLQILIRPTQLSLGGFYRPARRASGLSRHADDGAIFLLYV